jgi:hypothetical protein
MTKEKSKAREKETSNGQQSFWRYNSQMFSTCSDTSLRKVDSDDGCDGHVATSTEQVDTVSVDDGEMTGDGVRTVR